MLSQVLPVLLQLLHTSNHDGTRISAISAVKTLTWPPANTDFRQAEPSQILNPPRLRQTMHALVLSSLSVLLDRPW